MKTLRKLWDFGLFILLLLISMFGLMMVYSSSFTFAILEYGDATYFLKKQLMWIIFGFTIFAVVSFIPYKLYGEYIANLVYIIILSFHILLFLVLYHIN